MALNLTMGGGEGKANGEIPIKRSKLLHKITRNENPVRSNDGTSSGAIAADRLRNARRNAIENMIVTFPQRSLVRPPRTSSFSELRSDQASSTKERGLAIKLIENPVRSNDGTSSGALVADRLRQSRRKAIENMNAQLSISRVTQIIETPATSKLEKERGINIQMIENAARSSDGTSSGAIAADRLRMSRQKALERMKSQHHALNESEEDT